MIFVLIFIFIAAFLLASAALFSALGFVFSIIPTTWISYFLSFTGYLGGVIDLPHTFGVMRNMVTFETFWFSFLIAWWVVGFFRGVFSRGNTDH